MAAADIAGRLGILARGMVMIDITTTIAARSMA
jgi:hypothetical protein